MPIEAVTLRVPTELLDKLDKRVAALAKANPEGTYDTTSVIVDMIKKALE